MVVDNDEGAQNGMTKLPLLHAGDKAVIAPVHPVVTVCKNYMANKKLRQESITLKQDPQQTWCKLLPRTDLQIGSLLSRGLHRITLGSRQWRIQTGLGSGLGSCWKTIHISLRWPKMGN